MTRLIDADVLDSVILRLNTEENAQITRGEYKLIENVIFEFPTIDAVPVKHGKWVNANEGRWNTCEVLKCSECGELDNRMYKTDKYCPNCGARMDK